MPSPLIKRFGTDEAPAETRLLRAGPLTAELDAGNLRYIRIGGHEAIRAVFYVIRDLYWGTYNAEIEDLRVTEDETGFAVTYDARCGDDRQRFRYAVQITGRADGTLRFEGRGVAETDFETNRTGFVVLHPVAGVSGRPVEVRHVDGRVVQTEFPAQIDPKQPIMDIRALTHEVCPGVRVTCTMEGDTFEMEDQRNWIDASYKTYVRPLDLPKPFTIAAGEELVQSVELRFEGPLPASPSSEGAGRVTVRLGEQSGTVPRFGMGLEAQHAAAAALEHGADLDALRPAFVSGFVDARKADHRAALGAMGQVAQRLGAELGLEIVVPDEADPATVLEEIADAAGAAGLSPTSVAVTLASHLEFVMPGTVFSDTRDFDRLYAAARAVFPGCRLGGGNFVYFTELNRMPPPVEQLDFVIHGICAIVHMADDRSVAETVESLPYVVQSARGLFGDKPYRVSPVGIGSRTSPFGNEPTPNPDAQRITMVRADPRQRGLLGAAWHLGCAARLAEGGVDEVALAAPVGEFGLIHHAMDFRQPWFDEAGGVYPAYHVARAVYAASGRPRIATEVSSPRDVQALSFEGDRGPELWLASLSERTQTVSVEGAPHGTASLTLLDEPRFEACANGAEAFEAGEARHEGADLDLAPYAVARLRWST